MSKLIKAAAVEDTPLVLQLRQQKVDKQKGKELSPQDETAALLDQANSQAADILRQAKEEASLLLENAQAQAEELKLNAQQEGYQEGLEEAKVQADEIRQQARQVLAQTEEVRRQTYQDLEEEIISLAVEIAEKFISTQLRLEPEISIETAQQAIRLVKDRQRITIYVHPTEVDLYITAKQELEQMLSDQTVLTIIADEEVKSGGCLIDTDQGLVDARYDARWQWVLKAIYPS